MNAAPGDNNSNSADSERRSFLTRFLAVVVGGFATLFPFAVGSGVLLDPLRRRQTAGNGDGESDSDAAEFTRICPLSALPADGTPHPFVVTTELTDAWTRVANQRVGSVFLIRMTADGKPQVTAFTATCPHLGCAVEFDAGRDHFECPCHESGFGKDGQKLFGPSLRGLDSLEVKLDGEGEDAAVLVAFRRFRAGVAERIPLA